MKGNWKNNIGGWNTKDTRRKKQTHNNRLRDDGKYVIKTFDTYKEANKKINKNVFRHDTETILITKGSYRVNKPIVNVTNVFEIYISWNKINDDGDYILDYIEDVKRTYSNGIFKRNIYLKEGRYIKVYPDPNSNNININNIYYVEGTTINLLDYLGLTHKQKRSVSIGYKKDTRKTILLPEELLNKAIERKNKINITDFNLEKDFIYNKPLPRWKRRTFYNDGKRRKIAQNRANRMDRRNIKHWINKGDFDSEVKTHALSKSIAWEID